jgi:hypothetical protein
MDWKKTLPFLGALATGGVPALVAAAASAIGDALGTPVDATPQGIDDALKAATPEQLATLKQIDADLKIKMRGFDVEEKRIAASTEETYVKDVAHARQFNANTHGVLILGYLVNLSSYLCIAGVLYGCFQLLGGAEMKVDPGIAAMIGGVVGAAVQWIMNNAAQANGFFFGSSPSARQVSADLAKAVGDAAGKK